jgi:hypothetical protein
MATKYCDPWLYNSAKFTGSISGSTLTVTSVESGVILPGAAVIHDLSAFGSAHISSGGTGTGGVGTYTLGSTLPGTISSRPMKTVNGNPATTPVWGVAQDGDGLLPGIAVPATLSIDLSAATAAAGSSISIMGAVLTCVASAATTNQFNAGSGATLVSNLVAAINRTTNTVNTLAQAVGWGARRLQDSVFARVGGTSTILEVMTRAGAASYNSSQVVTSGFTGGTFGPYTFSGGQSGAWGWVTSTIIASWPSGIYANAGYGILSSGNCIAGMIDNGDEVFIRAGGDLYIGIGSSSTITPNSLGTIDSPVSITIDDGTVWGGDANPVLRIIHSPGSNSYALSFNFGTNSGNFDISGKKYSNGVYNLQFVGVGSSSGSAVSIIAGRYGRLANFSITALIGDTKINTNHPNSVSPHYVYENFSLSSPKNGANFMGSTGTAGTCQCIVRDGVISNEGATTPNTGVFNLSQIRCYIEFTNIKFTNFVVGSELLIINPSLSGVISFNQCEFNNVTKRGPYLGQISTLLIGKMTPTDFAVTMANRGTTKDFSIDTLSGFCEWNSSRSFPTASARLDDGVTPFSIRVIPASVAGKISKNNPLKLPRFSKINTLPDGQRTFTVNFIAEQTVVLTKADISLYILYVDVNGVQRRINTWETSGAISPSTLTWSSESGGFVTFQESGTVNHLKYKLEAVTPIGQDLKLGTEVSIWVCIHKVMADVTKTIFIDPEIVIS